MASGHSDGPSGADEPAGPSVSEARQALDALAGISDVTERLLEAAAIIQEQLAAVGTPTAVVGGLAVAYWTRAQYITTEIDVLMPVSPRASQVLEDLPAQERRSADPPEHCVRRGADRMTDWMRPEQHKLRGDGAAVGQASVVEAAQAL